MEPLAASIEAEARKASAVLVLEPALPGGALKTARKGCGEFELTVTGVAAHAGVDPGKGRERDSRAGGADSTLEQLQDLDRGISVNVGVVSGGTRPNVVAAEARAIDRCAGADGRGCRTRRRPRFEPCNRGGRACVSISRADSTGLHWSAPRPSSGCSRLPATWPPRSVATCSRDRPAADPTATSPAAIGVPTLDGLGAVGDGAHAAHEHVDIDALPWRAALIAGNVDEDCS